MSVPVHRWLGQAPEPDPETVRRPQSRSFALALWAGAAVGFTLGLLVASTAFLYAGAHLAP